MFELRLENSSGSVVNINDGKRFSVIGISGLNPPSASIFTSKSPNRKGARKNGSTLNERIIVVSVKLLGDIEANRNALYSWVDPEEEVKIYYRNSTKNVYCEGTVSDCDIDFFTDNEVVGVSILCPDPFLKDVEEIVADISALLKQFTFPFAIDSAGIPFSTIRGSNNTGIFNAGAETGVKITITCRAEVKNIRIYDATDTTREFKINGTIPAGWVITIDTDGSPKTCKAKKPDGSTVNLFNRISQNPTWFTLKRGNNSFGYTAESGLTDTEVTFSFSNKYLGV